MTPFEQQILNILSREGPDALERLNDITEAAICYFPSYKYNEHASETTDPWIVPKTTPTSTSPPPGGR